MSNYSLAIAHKDYGPSLRTQMNVQPQDHEQPARASRGARGHLPLRIRRILVPIDFSECSNRAVDYAVAFAEQFESTLVLLHVVEPSPGAENYLATAPAMDETNDQLLQAGRERLVQLSLKRVGHRDHVETLARMGRAHSEITDTALALGADLIIMGTHGHSGFKHLLLGSTAEKVVRHAACPVLTVRQSAT